jgi:hypothetical protein
MVFQVKTMSSYQWQAGNGDVDRARRRAQLPLADLQQHALIAASAGGVNRRVAVEHGGNAECVPDAVAPPSAIAGLHRKSGGHGGEGSGAPEFAIVLETECMGLHQAPQSGADGAC